MTSHRLADSAIRLTGALTSAGFALLHVAWLLGMGPGTEAPPRHIVSFATYAALSAFIALGLSRSWAWSSWIAVAFGLLYLVPGLYAFAITDLWSATSMPLARQMLWHFGAALVLQASTSGAGAVLLIRSRSATSAG